MVTKIIRAAKQGVVPSRIGVKGGGSLIGGSNPLGGRAALDPAHPIGIHKVDGFDFAEAHALRLAVAQIALGDFSVDRIEIHGTKRAEGHAGAVPIAMSLSARTIEIVGRIMGRNSTRALAVRLLFSPEKLTNTFLSSDPYWAA